MFFRISVLYMSTSFFENFLLWLPSFVHKYVYFILFILEKHASYFCVLKYLKYIKSKNSNSIFFITYYFYFLLSLFSGCCCSKWSCLKSVVVSRSSFRGRLFLSTLTYQHIYCFFNQHLSTLLPHPTHPLPSFRSTRWTCSFDRRGWTAGWCTRGRLKFYGSTTWWWPRFGHQTPSSGTARSQSLTTWRRQTSSSALWRTAPFCTPWGRAARSGTQTVQTGSQVADFCSEHWDRQRWWCSRKWRG